MGLDTLVNDENDSNDSQTEYEDIENGRLDEVTLPVYSWRYFLLRTKCNVPIDEDEMELWEIQAILDFINHELYKKRPFGKDPEDLPLKHMKRHRDNIEDTLEAMKNE